MAMKRRAKGRIAKKKKNVRSRKMRRVSKYKAQNVLNAKCTAFHIHQFKDSWLQGDDKTAARLKICWTST